MQQVPFGDEIFEELEQNRHAEIIMMGDFNVVFDNKSDHSKDSLTSGFLSNFHHYIESFRLVDLWQKAYSSDQDYTSLSVCQLSHSRIDLMLVSEGLDCDMENAFIGPRILSDHTTVFVDWQIVAKTPRTCG